MGRYSFTTRPKIAAIVATLVASLVVGVSGAQAIVVNANGVQAGVSLVPSDRGSALPSGVSAVTSGAQCQDPWLATDLGGPAMAAQGLCYRGGPVVHKNEVFALTWDQHRNYWSVTRGYVEQFLRDVADASGSLGSPYAVSTQYNDAGGRAQNASLFGGGCIDYGNTGGSACEYGSPTGAGHDFPANGCVPGGDSFIAMGFLGSNTVCLTDAQIQGEVATMVAQTGIIGRTSPGYTPLVTLLLPPGVTACLDPARALCSANGQLTPPPPVVSSGPVPNGAPTGLPAGNYLVQVTYTTAGGESAPSSVQSLTLTDPASQITVSSPPPTTGVTGWNVYISSTDGSNLMLQNGSPLSIGSSFGPATSVSQGAAPPSAPSFCSYHSQVNVGGTAVPYVVQPWTAGTGCDETGIPDIPQNPSAQQLSVAIGQRLVSPLSQSHIAALVNPALNGWANTNGSEIEDNTLDGYTCQPLPKKLDMVTVGSSSQNPYWLQREFTNGATLEYDPFTYFGCAPVVDLNPNFVAPSAVNQGDVVQFDGSSTASTLVVPNAGYVWNFGDGSAPAVGPSVVHTFAQAGTWAVTLNVTDRGGNKQTFSQNVTVLNPNGQPVTPPPGNGGGGSAPPFKVHLMLLPEGLRWMLSHGLLLRVSANQTANGLITVSITRQAAKRAHISAGRSPSVVIGRGTVWQVANGTVTLHLHLSGKMAAKLRGLRHLNVTVRLSLLPTVGRRVAVVVAGRY